MNTNSTYGKRLFHLLPSHYQDADTAGNGHLGLFLNAAGGMLDRIDATLRQRFRDISPIDCQEWLLPYIADLLDVRLVSPDVEGQRNEIAEAISWRQKKGTLVCVYDIVKAIGRFPEAVIHEGHDRVLTTACFGIPKFSDGIDPGFTSATVDFQKIVDIEEVRIADRKSQTFTTDFGDGEKLWRPVNRHSDGKISENPHILSGIPVFPGSFRDLTRRTVDFRSPNYRYGHCNPRRVLIFTGIPNGFFAPERVRIPWRKVKALADAGKTPLFPETGVNGKPGMPRWWIVSGEDYTYETLVIRGPYEGPIDLGMYCGKTRDLSQQNSELLKTSEIKPSEIFRPLHTLCIVIHEVLDVDTKGKPVADRITLRGIAPLAPILTGTIDIRANKLPQGYHRICRFDNILTLGTLQSHGAAVETYPSTITLPEMFRSRERISVAWNDIHRLKDLENVSLFPSDIHDINNSVSKRWLVSYQVKDSLKFIVSKPSTDSYNGSIDSDKNGLFIVQHSYEENVKMKKVLRKITITGISESPLVINDAIALKHPPHDNEIFIYRFENVVIRGHLHVSGAVVELYRSAAFEVDLNVTQLTPVIIGLSEGSANKVPDLKAQDSLIKCINATGSLCELEFCTVLGKIDCVRLHVTDSILLGELLPPKQLSPSIPAEGNPEKGIRELFLRYSWAPGITEKKPVTWRIHNDSVLQHVGGEPETFFYSTEFGDPGCGVLRRFAPSRIRTGAEPGGELGAYNHCHYCMREDALLDKLREFLPAGMEPVLIIDDVWDNTPLFSTANRS